ncbi:hypothetical protein C8Z91_14210 [Paenibacillus elgii]|uniref:Uncharacterized protein n=1 Tax=Paenibacillus elgii TaxID=189691 RepID=A0A2T6G3J7_9BACL|nr:hypothetical protein [Paenibacillus elgii]PUA38739.1 hypothetical protein C8Z91_14210 [Paenibacillus elgii]
MKRLISQYLFLILGGAIILLGMVFAGINFSNHIPVNDRVMLSAPGTKEVFLSSGKNNLFYEFDSKQFNLGVLQLKKEEKFNNITNLVTVKINKVSDNKEIVLAKDSSMNFTFNDIRGESLYSFEVVEEGDYRVEISPTIELPKAITFSIVGDLANSLLGVFKQAGIVVSMSIPFLLIGWYMYAREARRKKLLTR